MRAAVILMSIYFGVAALSGSPTAGALAIACAYYAGTLSKRST